MAGQDVTCAAAELAVGAAVTITVSGVLAESTLGAVTNTASVTVADDTAADNNEASSTTATVPTVDLAVTKEAVDVVFVPGRTAQWRITVTNNGPSTALGARFTDELGAGLTNASVAPEDPDTPGAADWDCSASTAAVASCTAGALAAGAAMTFLVGADLDPATTGAVANAVVLTSATFDPTLGNNASATSTATTGLADLALVKSDPTPNPPIAGEEVSWTLTVGNAGPSDARDAHVVDTLPAGLSDVTASSDDAGWSCSVAGGQAVCDGERLAAGATATVTVSGVLASDLTGEISNTASVSSPVEDPDSADDSDTVTSPVRALADLAVAKELTSPSPGVPGSPVTWTLTVTNNGASLARAVTLTDVVPDVVGGVQVTTTAPAWTCGVAGQTVDCAADTLAAGASVTITVAGVLDPATTVDVVNTASVAASTTDEVPGNDTATARTPVQPTTALSLTKSQTIPNPAIAGEAVEWALTVVNAGPSTATGLTLDDAVVSDVELVGVRTAAPGWVCAASGQDVHCDAATMPVGSAITVFVTGVVRSDLVGTLPNTALLGQATLDPDDTDNSATSESPVAQRADLSVTKSAPTPAVPVPGEAVSWDVTVRNAGPSLALNALLADRVPDGVGDLTVTPGADAAGWSCAVDGQEVSCTAATVPLGAEATITIAGVLSPDFSGDLVNAANVTSDTVDLDPTDNTGVARAATQPRADLVLVKAGPATARAGDPITWTLTLTNAGPSTALNPRVVDLPPLEQLNDVVASVDDPSWSCEATNTGPDCSGERLAPGASVVMTVSAVIDPAFVGTFRQNATVDAATPDLDDASNVASVDTTVSAVADQGVTKTLVSEEPVVPGESVAWLIRVVNLGPSFARDSVVTDALPAGLTEVTVTTSAAFGSCAVADATLTCSIPEQGVGEANAVEIVVGGTLASDVIGDVTNTAELTSTTPDPSTGNDSSTVVVPVTPRPDLAVTVSQGQPDPAVAGGVVAWDLAVANVGPSDASDVVLTAVLPAGVADVTTLDLPDGWSVTATPDASGTTTLRFRAARVAAGATLAFRVSGVVDADATGQLAVTASVATGLDEPVLANNTDATSTPIVSSGGLEVVKTASTDVAAGVGAVVDYTVLVTNPGPSTVDAITVTDALATGVELAVTCPATSLAGAASMTCAVAPYTLTQADVDAGGVLNGATATGTLPDGVAVTGAGAATVGVELAPGLALTKSGVYADRGVAGGTTDDVVTWTFTLTNTGNTTVRDLGVDDPLVPGVVVPVSTLAPGASVTVTATTGVAEGWITVGQVRNTATATGLAPAPCPTSTADLVALAAVLACHASLEAVAATVVDVPAAPVVPPIPTPTPTLSPSPTATPTPTAGPTPAPSPTPTPAPVPPRLPQTGTDTTLGALAAGLALLLAGGLLLGYRRRSTDDKE